MHFQGRVIFHTFSIIGLQIEIINLEFIGLLKEKIKKLSGKPQIYL